jgi:acyl-CoA:acyl-CoA alkyltransferase
MLYKNVSIESFGYEIPPVRVTSSEIEERLGTVYKRLGLPEGRLELMTGIRERYFWEKGFKPSDGAIAAGKKALLASSVQPDEIGCLIMCSVCRDCLEPATACIVHHALGISENAMVFDISNACLGILTGIITAANMIEMGQIESAMLVAGENSRPLVESTINAILEDKSLTRQSIKPYFASLTIGSGAIAIILSRKQQGSGKPSLSAASTLAVTQYNNLCRGNADRGMTDNMYTLMNTDSEILMQHGVETAERTWEIFKKETGWENSTPDCFCTHQVGSAHRKLLFDKLKIDPDKDFPTIESFGNTGSVSCPLTMALAAEDGKLKQGDKLALLGIGSGINCTVMGVEW